LSTGEMHFTNAGHNPPMVRRASGQVEAISDRHGPVAGIMPDVEYEQSSGLLAPGDVLLVYTDGVTEAMNVDEQLYGDDRLLDVLLAAPDSDARAMVDRVNASVETFAHGAEQADDITLIALEFNG